MTEVSDFRRFVFTKNVAEVPPAEINTEGAETAATRWLLLVNCTVTPAAGAGALSVTVATTDSPPTAEEAAKVRLANWDGLGGGGGGGGGGAGAWTSKLLERTTPLSVAVNRAVVSVTTVLVVTVKSAEVRLASTVTVDGTCATLG